MKKERLWQVLKITLLYVVLGSLWIVLSDELLANYFSNRDLLVKLQTIKGWLFVAVTALLFFLVVASYEKRIDDTSKLLHRKNHDLRIFFDRMSHDLRGPVATILGLTNIGKRFTEKGEAIQVLERVELTAKKSDKIIKELIKITSILDREVSLDFINAEEIIEETIKEVRLKTMEREWPDVQRRIPSIAFETDERLLTFALHEIINNAIQYRKKESPHQVLINVRTPKRQMLEITIRDSGIGISKTQVHRVHELFYRGTSSKGAGIGLYTANLAVEKLSGSIKVQGNGESGAAFTISLPCRVSNFRA